MRVDLRQEPMLKSFEEGDYNDRYMPDSDGTDGRKIHGTCTSTIDMTDSISS